MHKKRLLLKLSGEVLVGKEGHGICPEATMRTAKILAGIQRAGYQLAVVIGGGNIFRGGARYQAMGIEQTPADYIGMLATLMNGVALEEALKNIGANVLMMSALECPKVAQTYNWQQARNHMNMGRLLIFTGGTGNPFFTTDTAAALRACEIGALLLKATKVDGIYSADPIKDPKAKRYETITYTQAIEERLGVMDATAFALCMNNKIPLFVFNMEKLNDHTIEEILADKRHGTLVKGE